MLQTNTFNLSGSNYKRTKSGERVFIEYLGEDSYQHTSTEEVVEKRQSYEIGDINKYGEMKVSNTKTSKDWVYVGKRGKDHPKVKHLFE